MFKKIDETAHYIKSRMDNRKPRIGIVLGSGLGVFADKAEDRLEISYEEIPHFHKTTVVGHMGRLVIGRINDIEVAIFQGRFHAYEGHSNEDVVLPVRVLSQIGVEQLLLTNASGGINSQYSPGELVCITDHINLTGSSPLLGPNEDKLGVRFPDMSEIYDRSLNELLLLAAKEAKVELKMGVYAGMLGPSYETPAEIKMLEIIGADLVGMSTVPESIAANHAGLRTCAISCVTNMAAGISKEKLSHDDVKDVANKAMANFSNLLSAFIKQIGAK